MAVRDKPFSVTPIGTVVRGVATADAWLNVTNTTAAMGMRPDQHLLAANIKVTEGPFEIEVPGGRYGDYVRVTQHVPLVGRTSTMVRLRAGLRRDTKRQPYTARQAFELVEAEPGKLRVASRVRSRQFAFPRSQVWFRNSETGAVAFADIDDRGHLPTDFRLEGESSHAFDVVVSADPLTTPPNFDRGRRLACRAPTPELFDHEDMVEHTGPLFGAGISADDPIQGRVGNCWFVADFAAVADTRPDLIDDMIEPLDDGTFRVTFKKYDETSDAYVDDPVIVSPKFFRDGYGMVYGRNQGSNAKDRMKLAFPIVEKAYAQLRGSYAGTKTGGCGDAFETILGAAPRWLGTSETDPRMLFDSIAEALENGQPVSAATRESFRGLKAMFSVSHGRGLVADHAYTVRAAFLRRGKPYIKLRNTWGRHRPMGYRTGRRGDFELPLDVFLQTFGGAAIAQLPDSAVAKK